MSKLMSAKNLSEHTVEKKFNKLIAAEKEFSKLTVEREFSELMVEKKSSELMVEKKFSVAYIWWKRNSANLQLRRD